MYKVINNKFKGVVFFGQPGSGKTTLAKLLASKIQNSKYVETSTVIKFAMGTKSLPNTAEQFLSDFSDSGENSFTIDREKAREMFIKLTKKYSKTIIAETIDSFYGKKFKSNFLILGGARGLTAAEYYRLRGYLVVYLDCSHDEILKRLQGRENNLKQISSELRSEEVMYSTNRVKKISELVFDTSVSRKDYIVKSVIKYLTDNQIQECKKCINNSLNPAIKFDKKGHCNICQFFLRHFSRGKLNEDMNFFKSLKNSEQKYDIMVGISGGKDSTATLFTVKEMGFKPLAFTFDIGYYPKHTFVRARKVANKLDVSYQKINIKKYIRPVDYKCYKLMAELYDQPESLTLKDRFIKLYKQGREHYSIKCKHARPFVRTCQLCRRTVIRAYYVEASSRKIKAIALGANEWAGLSGAENGKGEFVSAIRKLQPYKNKPPVYVIHLPFLLQRNIQDTKKILKKIGWKEPVGENLIESNSNSCLLAEAAENKTRRLLGFHPDTTRLAREVTVGFLKKEEAKIALEKVHEYKYSVRDVLKGAGLL